MANLSIRKLDDNMYEQLRIRAAQDGISMEEEVRRIIYQAIAAPNKQKCDIRRNQIVKKRIYHDLDQLAGTWSAKDEKEFANNTRYFEKIDEHLWI